MTLCLAWKRKIDGRDELVFATDSLILGGYRYPYGTKLVVFPERRCGLCWEGDTSFTYSFVENVRVDVLYSDGLNKPDVPLFAVARRITKVFNELWKANVSDAESVFRTPDCSFLFGGYCTKYNNLQNWHIAYNGHEFVPKQRRHISANSPFMIGSGLERAKKEKTKDDSLSPYQILRTLIEDVSVDDVGGVPQMASFSDQGTTIIGIERDQERYLFGRPLNSNGHRDKIKYISYAQNEY